LRFSQNNAPMDFRYYTNLWRKDKTIPKPSKPLVFVQCGHLDNNKQNMDELNLLTLCPKCHLKRDAAWKKYIRLSNK
jgi:hypothetical protein